MVEIDEGGWSPGPIVAYNGCTLLAQSNWIALHQQLEGHREWQDKWQSWADDSGILRLSFFADDQSPGSIYVYLQAWFRDLEQNGVADPGLFESIYDASYYGQLDEDLDDLEEATGYLNDADRRSIVQKLKPDSLRHDIDGTPYHAKADLMNAAKGSGLLRARAVSRPSHPRYAVLLNKQAKQWLGGQIVDGDPHGNYMQLKDEASRSEVVAKKHGGAWSINRMPGKYELISDVSPRKSLQKNPGPGMGGFLGWWVGAMGGSLVNALVGGGAPGALVGWTLASLGAAYGAKLAAPPDRRRRAFIGAGVGGAIFPIIGLGAATGGWIGAMKPDDSPEE